MKIILIFLFAIFGKLFLKTTATVGLLTICDHAKSQVSYTSGGNTGNNSWSVYQTNSPTNIYGNRYNCLNINRDSIILRTKYVMLDSMYMVDRHIVSGGKVAWLNGRQMQLSKFDSIPLSVRQITMGLGYNPSSMSLTGGTNVTITGSYPSYTLSSPTQTIALTSSAIYSALTFTPYNSTNPNGYINSIPAQSFSSLTGKPTTLSGYGITDAYPLSGNPSAFLTSEVDGSTSNEIQTLSGSGTNTISLSGGGSFVIPVNNATITAGTNISVTTSGNTFTVINTNTLTSLVAGTGINVSGNTITNSLPHVNTNIIVSSGLTSTTSTNAYTLAIQSRTYNSSPARALSTTGTNNTFVINATNDNRVSYTINFSVALVSVSSNGFVGLDYSIDGGSNWITVSSVSQVYGASILTTNGDIILSGEIPANARVRIYRSTATNCTITIGRQQEITY